MKCGVSTPKNLSLCDVSTTSVEILFLDIGYAIPSKFLGRCCWMPSHWLPEQIWKWRKVSWIQRRFTNQNGEACVWKHPKLFRFQIFSWPTSRYNKMMHHFLNGPTKTSILYPKEKENHPAIQSELDSPSVDLLNTKQAQRNRVNASGVSNMV